MNISRDWILTGRFLGLYLR